LQQSDRNKSVVERFIKEVFVNHDFTNLDAVMRDDYIQHNPDVAQGKAGFKQFFIQTFKAMPDFKYTIIRLVAEGDYVMAYCVSSGTHSGGVWLNKQASGNKLNFNVVDIFRVQDGLIAEHWDVADTLTMFSQLGLAVRIEPPK
jgi:predicted SnoaL-like aldol condensation-catalyzing enzyme